MDSSSLSSIVLPYHHCSAKKCAQELDNVRHALSCATLVLSPGSTGQDKTKTDHNFGGFHGSASCMKSDLLSLIDWNFPKLAPTAQNLYMNICRTALRTLLLELSPAF
eukprot:3689138-Amphidinium_carterae.1